MSALVLWHCYLQCSYTSFSRHISEIELGVSPQSGIVDEFLAVILGTLGPVHTHAAH